MHSSSYRHMQSLVDKYLFDRDACRIYDLGSFDVNGCYRPLFERSGWTYQGVDLEPGTNVDIVLQNPYHFPLPANSADLFISGQAFEHIEFFWVTTLEIARILKPGGMFFLIAPSRGPEHRYPVDCWRFYPDGYRALARYAGLELLEVNTDWLPTEEEDSVAWGDTVGVFRKKSSSLRYDIIRRLRCFIHRLALPTAG